jgi:hypothetical protein
MSQFKDSLEIHLSSDGFYVARIESSFVPPVGCLINIRKKDYKVDKVDFSIDDANTMTQRIRCNVYVSPV